MSSPAPSLTSSHSEAILCSDYTKYNQKFQKKLRQTCHCVGQEPGVLKLVEDGIAIKTVRQYLAQEKAADGLKCQQKAQ